MPETESGQQNSSAENPAGPAPAPKPRAFPLRMNRPTPPAAAPAATPQPAPAAAEPAAQPKKTKKTSRKATSEPAPQEPVPPEGAPVDVAIPSPAAEAPVRAPQKDRLNESLLYLLWVESFVFLLAAVTALINILVLTVSRTAEVDPTVSQNIFMASLYQSVARAVTTVLCPLFLINVAMAPVSFFVLTGKGASAPPRDTLGHLLNLIVALLLGATAFFFFVVTDFGTERLKLML